MDTADELTKIEPKMSKGKNKRDIHKLCPASVYNDILKKRKKDKE